jgi:hypothetical protein
MKQLTDVAAVISISVALVLDLGALLFLLAMGFALLYTVLVAPWRVRSRRRQAERWSPTPEMAALVAAAGWEGTLQDLVARLHLAPPIQFRVLPDRLIANVMVGRTPVAVYSTGTRPASVIVGSDWAVNPDRSLQRGVLALTLGSLTRGRLQLRQFAPLILLAASVDVGVGGGLVAWRLLGSFPTGAVGPLFASAIGSLLFFLTWVAGAGYARREVYGWSGFAVRLVGADDVHHALSTVFDAWLGATKSSRARRRLTRPGPFGFRPPMERELEAVRGAGDGRQAAAPSR